MTTPDDGKAFLQLCLAKRLIDKDQARTVWQEAKTNGSAPQHILVERGLMAAPTIEALEKELKRAQEPRTIGGFRLIRPLGQGGMARVFLAEQLSLKREVALKLMAPNFAGDTDAVERFLREARTAATVNHPNVVSIIDVGQADGQLYMAMELVTGGDAAQLAKRSGGALQELQALKLMVDCTKGLQALHDARLVHRDLKPSNIFITGDGNAKLGDLGLARSEDGADRMTMTGHLVGTPAFMSPEQAGGSRDLDIRSDIYSLGATLFALVTGRQPFEGNGPIAVAAKVLTSPVPDPRSIVPNLSPDIAALIQRAMAKDPAQRFRTPNELREALEQALLQAPTLVTSAPMRARSRTTTSVFRSLPEGSDTAATLSLPGRRVTTRTVRRKLPKAPWPIILAAVVISLGVVLLLVALSGPPRSEHTANASQPPTTVNATVANSTTPPTPTPPVTPDPPAAKGAPASPPTGQAAPRATWASAQGRDRFGEWAVLRVKNAEQRLRWIPPGHSRIGVPASLPEHLAQEEEIEVDFTFGVWMADTECTQAMYQAVMGSNPATVTGELLPVTNLSIVECISFTRALGKALGGTKARLPSRAEWERACRAGTTSTFSTGDEPASLDGYANLCDQDRAKANGIKATFPFADGFPDLAPVAQFKPNRWGLYDMHGNVCEYCLGVFGALRGQQRDPMISEDVTQNGFIKGGSYDSQDTIKVRCGALPHIGTNAHNPDIGLRFLIEAR